MGRSTCGAWCSVNLARGVDWIKTRATERAGTARHRSAQADLHRGGAPRDRRGGGDGGAGEAHAHGAEGALAAVRAGARNIEHGTYLTDPALRLMKQRGTFRAHLLDR